MGVMNLHVELCALVWHRSFGEDEPAAGIIGKGEGEEKGKGKGKKGAQLIYGQPHGGVPCGRSPDRFFFSIFSIFFVVFRFWKIFCKRKFGERKNFETKKKFQAKKGAAGKKIQEKNLESRKNSRNFFYH